MKVRTFSSISLTVLTLTTALFLSACGGQKQSTTASSSSNKTEQRSKKPQSSSKAKSNKQSAGEVEVETKESSSMENSSPASSGQEAKPTTDTGKSENKQDPTPNIQATTLDLNAIANGDFSSLAGTWQNDQGQTVTINQDGTTSDGAVISTNTPKEDIYIASIRFKDGSGSGVWVAPAGKSIPADLTPSAGLQGIDETRDRLMIGQSADAFFHPFYRV